ncbi:hypothetical protein Ciccas_002213 [Cichlidogyrus casuarinus]|uniref:SH2 domain-containing protein n=1 Tax=Cichlidogyrus casuarinus TaxID=1844966 RepID=A0ABD2QHW7_9PLAT
MCLFQIEANQGGPQDKRHSPSPPMPPVRLNSLRRFVASTDQLEINKLVIQHSNAKLNESSTHSDDNLMVKNSNNKLELISSGLTNKLSSSTTKICISDEEAQQLATAPWYQALIPRDLALQLLSKEEVGSFVVRESVSRPNCCALSVRVPSQGSDSTQMPAITHYLIERTQEGRVKMQRFDKEWKSLPDLINHLSKHLEMLPCTLKLPPQILSNNPVFSQAEPAKPQQNRVRLNGSASEMVEDEVYQKLSDFATLMMSQPSM